ncbi:MAG: hypothetical protein R8J85_08745 [Mariprofundales bacterium]
MMMRVLYRGICLLSLVLLGACANSDGGGSASNVTTVTIGVGGVNVGVASTIPANIASFRVDALQNGATITSASATLPTTSVQLTLSNGLYSFRLVAFDATGVGVFQGVSATVALTGTAIPIAINMTGFVAVTAGKTTANPGDVIHFSATFSNAAPTATNPLVWSASAGTVTIDSTASFGASATWVAPTKPGTYTVTAKVDVAVSPKQTYNHSGDVTINVGDVTPPTIIPSSADFSLPDLAGVGISLQTPGLGAKLQAWLNGFTALDNADGFVAVTHSTLPALFTAGKTTVQFFATDAAGNKATLSTTVTVYTSSSTTFPSSTTFHAQDLQGNSIPNIALGGVAVGSQSAVAMVNAAGSSQTDASGNLVASGLNAAETYLVIAASPQDSYADGYWGGALNAVANVVSIYGAAAPLTNFANSTTTLVMAAGGHISGQVLDANGVAIPHARVDYSLAPYDNLGAHFTTFATTAGVFTIGAEPGSYQLFVPGTALNADTGVEQALTSRLSGGFYAGNNAVVSPYANQAATVTVTQGATQTVTMKLVAGGGMVAGRVYTPAGAPIRTMRVNIEPYGATGSPITYEAVTDVSGLYQLNVPPGLYQLAATNKQFNPVTRIDGSLSSGVVGGFSATAQGSVVRKVNSAQLYYVAAGGQTIVDFTLQQGGAVTGKVTGGGAFVRIFAQDVYSNDTQQIFTDGLGNYTLNMMPGTVRLVVDSYSMDQVSGQLVAFTGGVTGGYVNSAGVAQSLQTSAASFVVTANGTITQNIQLNTGTPFDAAAVVGSFIP